MSDLTEAAAELLEAYQEAAGSSPTITHDGETVDVMPAAVDNDKRFVGGGFADAGEFEVCSLSSAWVTPPEDRDVVTLADHSTAPDGAYQVLSRRFNEAWLIFTLGNSDA